jgi:hypothetical protein
MTNPFKQGSAPGRERPEYLRPGTFEKSHEKRDGRKRGTPNVFSRDYKQALFEAAYSYDGNGKKRLGRLFPVGSRPTSADVSSAC